VVSGSGQELELSVFVHLAQSQEVLLVDARFTKWHHRAVVPVGIKLEPGSVPRQDGRVLKSLYHDKLVERLQIFLVLLVDGDSLAHFVIDRPNVLTVSSMDIRMNRVMPILSLHKFTLNLGDVGEVEQLPQRVAHFGQKSFDITSGKSVNSVMLSVDGDEIDHWRGWTTLFHAAKELGTLAEAQRMVPIFQLWIVLDFVADELNLVKDGHEEAVPPVFVSVRSDNEGSDVISRCTSNHVSNSPHSRAVASVAHPMPNDGRNGVCHGK